MNVLFKGKECIVFENLGLEDKILKGKRLSIKGDFYESEDDVTMDLKTAVLYAVDKKEENIIFREKADEKIIEKLIPEIIEAMVTYGFKRECLTIASDKNAIRYVEL